MSLSEFLSGLFGQSGTISSPDSTDRLHQGGERKQPTLVHECRACGTTVSAATERCPACERGDIVTHTID